MLRKIDWDNQIGHRLRLRDLHVFFTVAQVGSMSKAAARIGVSTPTVSEVIAGLEHGLGVRLFDRGPKGVEPTRYGDALLKRALTVFDELKQSIKDIEYLEDPASGEIRIAAALAIAFTVIPHVFERFTKRYPRAVLHFDEVTSSVATRDLQELRERKYDLILERGKPSETEERAADDLNIETLFDDQLVIVAGSKNKWATRRRKIDLAELVNEPWIMQAPHSWNHSVLSEEFRGRGLAMPRASLVTLSMSVITHFLAGGRFIASMPRSVAHFKSLRILPLDLPSRPWPVNVVTLRNRTRSPVVDRFIESAREFTRPMREQRLPAKR